MFQADRYSRRFFISMVGGAGLAGMLQTPLAFARGLEDRYLILVILRGALDGLGAVIPYHEGKLRDWREILVPPEPGEEGGALSLDADGFAFNPAMKFMHDSYRAGDLSVLHAASSGYRERSHFDGQDVLENGAGGVLHARDGWLNRALQKTSGDIEAAAVGGALPLVLRGDAHAVSWAPSFLPEPGEDTLERLMRMYEGDDALRTALRDAQELDMAAGEMKGDARQVTRGRDYEPLMEAGANLVSSGAAGVVVLSLSGWDTHNSQGAGSGTLSNRLRQLDDGLFAMKKALGPKWDNSAIVVTTEFGRTVKVNGSRGSDHGTGGASFLLGGAVNGGRMLGDWPGLAGNALYEGRDLYPANDLRGLFKGVLRDHLGVARADLDKTVFPGSADLAPFEGLISVES
jgi:uncharacterized protein (DUF1501 family)